MKRVWCVALALSACNGEDADGDGASKDCDDGPLVNSFEDADGDGYGSDETVRVCAGTPNTASTSGDCDDSDPAVHPEAEEICSNGIDEDCVDGDRVVTWYADSDHDGYGDAAVTTDVCDAPDDYVADSSDCDDTDAAVHPGADERCDNTVDDDCDTVIARSDDSDGDGWYADACVHGLDCDDGNVAIHPEAIEVCGDAIDDDCDGADRPCGLFGDYDLADAPVTLVCDRFGYDSGQLVEAGDVTGDGIADLLVASFYGETGHGGGFVVPGPIAGGEQTLDDAGHHIGSDDAASSAGRSIAIGDVDGDRIGDLGFGAPYGSPGGQYILFGPITADANLGDADVSFTYALNVYAGYGNELADVDGDGIDDAIVGSPLDDGYALGSGAVFVEYGPVTAGAYDLYVDSDEWIRGENADAWAGRTIRAGRDLDGDGVGDLAISAIADSEIAASAGGVYVVYGPPAISRLSDADGWLPGTIAKSSSGVTLALGDYDGDGKADIAAGSIGSGVHIVNGPASGEHPFDTADAILVGGAHLGYGLGSGDVDDDGVDELVIGDPDDGIKGASTSWLVADPPLGTSDAAKIARAAFLGAEGDASGHGVTVGDLDDDGFGDVIIGAPMLGGGGGVYVETRAP